MRYNIDKQITSLDELIDGMKTLLSNEIGRTYEDLVLDPHNFHMDLNSLLLAYICDADYRLYMCDFWIINAMISTPQRFNAILYKNYKNLGYYEVRDILSLPPAYSTGLVKIIQGLKGDCTNWRYMNETTLKDICNEFKILF